MSVTCESPCYQEKRISVLVNNPFPEAGHFHVLLVEVTGGFPGYSGPLESVGKQQGMCTVCLTPFSAMRFWSCLIPELAYPAL